MQRDGPYHSMAKGFEKDDVGRSQKISGAFQEHDDDPNIVQCDTI